MPISDASQKRFWFTTLLRSVAKSLFNDYFRNWNDAVETQAEILGKTASPSYALLEYAEVIVEQ